MTTQTTTTGLQYEDTVIGKGKEATGLGQTAIVHYTGWLEDVVPSLIPVRTAMIRSASLLPATWLLRAGMRASLA